MASTTRRTRTDWFHDARWGAMLHYLASPPSTHDAPMSPQRWNAQIDAVDVEALAQQLAEMQPGYVIFTIGQNTGYFLSPNVYYEKRVAREESRLSNRDLMTELIAALKQRGIPMIAYCPSHAPAGDRFALESLRCTPAWDACQWQLFPGTYLANEPVDDRLSEFQENWQAVITEWSQRWGEDVRGWWFDGCYYHERMYRHDDAPNFASFAAAARTGNPEAIISFNLGHHGPPIAATEHEDYTAGEVGYALPVAVKHEFNADDGGRFVDHAQYHLLSYLGRGWGDFTLRFTDAFVIEYTRHVNARHGVMTWDVPIHSSGLIPDDAMTQMQSLAQATR